MKTVTRQVYYCEHCKRHRLTANAILVHEPKCIYNPDRRVCGWHGSPVPVPADYVPQLKDDLDLDLLRVWANGCPACMLAVVVQADLTWFQREDLGFDYKDEVARYRAAEQTKAYTW